MLAQLAGRSSAPAESWNCGPLSPEWELTQTIIHHPHPAPKWSQQCFKPKKEKRKFQQEFRNLTLYPNVHIQMFYLGRHHIPDHSWHPQTVEAASLPSGSSVLPQEAAFLGRENNPMTWEKEENLYNFPELR